MMHSHRTFPAVLAATLLASTALLGCQTILGIDFGSYEEGTGGGSAGASPGTGGTTPDASPEADSSSGGTAGTSGAAGEGGTAGAAGLGGASGSAGTGGSGGELATPQLLFNGTKAAWAMIVDDTALYWSRDEGSNDDMSICSMSKNGGGQVVLATHQPIARTLAQSSTHLFWQTSEAGNVSIKSVAKNVTDAGAEQTVYGPFNAGWAGPLLSDGTWLYFIENPDIKRLPLDGSGTAEMVSDLTAGGLSVTYMTGDATDLYFCAQGIGSKLARVSKSGGTPQVVTSSEMCAGVAVDDTNAYWINEQQNQVFAIPKAGGTATQVVKAKARPLVIASQGGYVYWSTLSASGEIYRTNSSLQIQQLAKGQMYPYSMAIDSTRLYWFNGGDASGFNGALYTIVLPSL